MTEYKKPLPTIDPDSKEYWEGARRHELVIQKCPECGYYCCYPFYPVCPRCNSMRREWVRVSGRGTIYSWAVVHSTLDEAFASEVPYPLVVVELDEQVGLRIVGRIVNCKLEDIRLGMPVEVVFHDVTEDITLPNWTPVS